MKPAILFNNFNRPEMTRLSLEAIQKYKPERLYICCDGPRQNFPEDFEKVSEVRKILAKISPSVEVHRLYFESNQGCRAATQASHKWFFKNEEMGIILEDDCLASPSFFDFASELLFKFKESPDIATVSGCNLGFKNSQNKNAKCLSYGTTKFFNMWGWATWRRTYLAVDQDMSTWLNCKNKFLMLTELLRRPEKNEKISPIWIEYWLYQFDRVASGNLDTWDYQWVFHILKNNMQCIVPSVNLVDNIGWGQQSATHTKIENSAFAIQTRSQERMTLVHPPVTKGQLPKTGATFENHLKKVWCLLPEFEKDRLQFRS